MDESMCEEDKIILVLNKQVLPEMNKIHIQLSIISANLDRFIADQNEQKKETLGLKKIVYGNGEIGLVSKVNQIEKWISNRVWFERLVVSAVVLETISVIILMVKFVLTNS